MTDNRRTDFALRSDSAPPQEAEQERALDALLAHASMPLPPTGLEERVLAAIRRDEAPAALLRGCPRYRSRRVWLTAAAAACLFAVLTPLLPWEERTAPEEALAIDEDVLVEEALDLIADEELITAICSVSTGNYSFMSNQ